MTTAPDNDRPRRAELSPSAFAMRLVYGLALLTLLRWCDAVLVPVVAAAVLALVAAGPVESLQRRGVPAAVAAAVVIGLPAVCIALVGASLAVAMPVGTAAMAFDPAAWYARLDASMLHWLRPSVQAGVVALEHSFVPMSVAAALTSATTLLLLFFVLLAQRPLLTAVLNALPDARVRLRLLGIVRESRVGVAGYVAVMTVCNLGLAVATAVGLAVMGWRDAPLWSVLVFVLAFVPYAGPAAIAVLLWTAGVAVYGSGVSAIGPALWFIALHGVEGNFISPWLTGRQLRLSRVAVLVAVIVGAWCWGLAGGMLAVPMLVVAQAFARRRRDWRLARALLGREPAATAWPTRMRLPGRAKR